jgi:hypothetical protein
VDRIYYQVLTVPAGTPITAPVSIAWPLEDNELREITVQVPDGPSGLAGFRIMRAGQQVIPFANDSFIVSNDRTFKFPFKDQVSSSGLVGNGYNTDIYDHSFYLTATVTNLPLPGVEPPAEVVAPGSQIEATDLTEEELTPESILGTDLAETAPTGPESIPPPVPGTPVAKKAPPKPVAKPKPKPVGKRPGPVKRR